MALLLIFFSVIFSLASSSIFIVERSYTSGAARFFLLNSTTGSRLATSPITYVYPDPLIEVTYSIPAKEIFIIGYPEGKDAVLYALDGSTLAEKNTWQKNSFSFFDLQNLQKNSSPSANTVLYGIYVSSSYGRELSRFDVGEDKVEAKPFFSLPYMWYVNASSADVETETYYALVNNFPGFPNSTYAQKLVISSQGSTRVYDVAQPGGDDSFMLRFISWSPASKKLFALGHHVPGGDEAFVCTLDVDNGKVTVIDTVKGVDISPTLVNNQHVPGEEEYCAFLRRRASIRVVDLYCWNVHSGALRVVKGVSDGSANIGGTCFVESE